MLQFSCSFGFCIRVRGFCLVLMGVFRWAFWIPKLLQLGGGLMWVFFLASPFLSFVCGSVGRSALSFSLFDVHFHFYFGEIPFLLLMTLQKES